jgi:hypothetical protein
VRKEHEVLHSLLIEDTIASTPSFLQPTLSAAHADAPFASTTAVRSRLSAMVKRGLEAGTDLWAALQARDQAALKTLAQKLDAPQVEMCAKWRLRDAEGIVCPRDEAAAPFGETLAHACAFAGAMGLPLLQRLLGTSAKADLARRRGISSGFTVLHSAVAGGHLEACRLLLDAGAKVNTSSSTRRTALWTACVKGLHDVALLLLERGADPYAAPQGAESAVDALRRIGGKAAMALHAELTSRSNGRSSAPSSGPSSAWCGMDASTIAAVTELSEKHVGEVMRSLGHDKEKIEAAVDQYLNSKSGPLKDGTEMGPSLEGCPVALPAAAARDGAGPKRGAAESAESADAELNGEEGEEGEEEEESEEEEEEEAEREARKALAAAAPKDILVPSLHPHPLEPCHQHRYCNVRGPGCKFSPTAFSCIECTWDVCQVCFDRAPREGIESVVCAAKDSVADLLHEISQATHDPDEGDTGEDDVGDAMLDDEDGDEDMLRLFSEAQRQTANGRRSDDHGRGRHDYDTGDDDDEDY